MNKMRIFSIVMLSFLIFFSCSDDNNNDNPMESSCDSPIDFQLIEYSLLSKVELGWNSGSDETEWEIEYGHSGFTQGNGLFTQATSEIITISNLDFNVAYDFYIRSICGTGVYSDWVGPVKNIPDNNTQSHALMTANINGTQYNNLVPFTWNIFNTAIGVSTFTTTSEKYIHLQGNSAPGDTTLSNTKEINLYIPESLWAVGTYTLGNNSVDNNQVPIPHVNIVYFDSSDAPSQAFERDNGTITITEIDLTNRVIKGTFEFMFDLYYTQSTDVLGPLDCLNGTFDYSLDHSYFD
jgi:hypothetical protein